MLPPATIAQIFSSIPRAVIIGSTVYPVDIEWSDTANISKSLRSKNIAISLRLSSDVEDDAWTTAGMLAAVNYDEASQTTIRRQYRRTTLTISVHTKDSAHHAAADIIAAYLNLLQIWIMSSLRDIVNIADDGGISDLSYIDEGKSERRDIILYLRYALDVSTTVETISEVSDPAIHLAI